MSVIKRPSFIPA